jgi:hypothetical protein
VCTCFLVCPFVYDYIDIDLSIIELLNIELLLLLLLYSCEVNCFVLVVISCFFLLTRADFPIVLWAVKFPIFSSQYAYSLVSEFQTVPVGDRCLGVPERKGYL